MTYTNIALIGANGHLGPHILTALLTAKTFKVTILSRSSSTSKYPSTAHVIQTSDSPSEAELTEALRGQDALVVSFAGGNSALQIQLADAALRAGVKLFIPADFGSCDSSDPRAMELLPLYREKTRVREHLVRLAAGSAEAAEGGFGWTSFVCGHFFDGGLTNGLLAMDAHSHKAKIFDGGDIRFSSCTLATVGAAVVAVLQQKKESETRNRMLYIQSFVLTQNQLMKVLEKHTGKEWEKGNLASKVYMEEGKRELEGDPRNLEKVEALVAVLGIVDSYWPGKEAFANGILGIQEEDVEDVVLRELKALKA